MIETMPTKEEWDEWLHLPATKALHKYLHERKEELKERWASGEFTDLAQFGNAILNAKAIGQCDALHEIANLEFDQVVGIIEDAE